MGLWDLLTLPIRTTYRSIALVTSIVFFFIRLGWTITWLTPMLGYIAYVFTFTFILYAAQKPQIPLQIAQYIKQASMPLCVAMSAVTEIPHYVIALKVVIILYVKLLGILGYWLGWFAMLIDVASIFFCLFLYAENIRNVETLVKEYNLPTDDSRFGFGTLISQSLSPLHPSTGENEVIVYKSVSFYTAEDLKQTSLATMEPREEGLLDVYACGEPSDTPKPTVLLIHGGRWQMGSKENPAPTISVLAQRGFVVVNINYRLAPKYPQPAGFEDCKLALTWTRRNISAFGGDPNFIILGGDSAGGHLAQLTAMTTKEGQDVQGTILLSPVLTVLDEFGIDAGRKPFFIKEICGGDAEAAQSLSIVHQLQRRAEVPPMLVIHGEADNLVSLESTLRFRVRAKEAGVDMTLLTLKNGHHAFMIFNSPRTIAVSELAADWAMKLYQERKKVQ